MLINKMEEPISTDEISQETQESQEAEETQESQEPQESQETEEIPPIIEYDRDGRVILPGPEDE